MATTPEAITFNSTELLGAPVTIDSPVETRMSTAGRKGLASLALVGLAAGGAFVGNTSNADASIDSFADTRPDLYQVSEDTASSAVETTTSTIPVEECVNDDTEAHYFAFDAPEGSNFFGPAPEKMYETPQEAYLELINEICDGNDDKADPLKTIAIADYFEVIEDQTTESSTAMAQQLATDKAAWNDLSKKTIDEMNKYDIALEDLSTVYETMYMKDADGNGVPEIYKSTEDMTDQKVLTFIHKEAKGEDGKNIVKRLKINCDWQPVDIDLPELSKLPPKGEHKTPTTKPGETTTTKPGEETTTTTSTSTTTSTPESTTTTAPDKVLECPNGGDPNNFCLDGEGPNGGPGAGGNPGPEGTTSTTTPATTTTEVGPTPTTSPEPTSTLPPISAPTTITTLVPDGPAPNPNTIP